MLHVSIAILALGGLLAIAATVLVIQPGRPDLRRIGLIVLATLSTAALAIYLTL